MLKKLTIIIALSATYISSSCQGLTPINGIYAPDHTIYAFTHAHIYITPDLEINDGTLVIKEGKIIASGAKVKIPSNAVVFNLKGKYIYPSFIDLKSNYGLPKVEKRKNTNTPQYVAINNGTLYWNDAIHPQYQAVDNWMMDDEKAEEIRKLGFGVVLTHQMNGIMQGTGTLVSLNSKTESDFILKTKAAAFYGFGKGNSNQRYPSSLMGSIALYRQAIYDAQWYTTSGKSKVNYSLQAIEDQNKLPQIFDAGDYQSVLRVNELEKEFGNPIITVSGGDAYKRIDEIKQNKSGLIIPMDFPKPYDVSNPLDEQNITLGNLKHWELAPTNLAVVSENKIPFAITSFENPEKFWENLRMAIKYGLHKTEALRALTITPAKMIGMEQNMGTLQPGMWANFLISDGDLFDENTSIHENWTMGDRNILKNEISAQLIGHYNMNIGKELFTMEVNKSKNGYIITTSMGNLDNTPQKGSITIENQLVNIVFNKGNEKIKGPFRIIAKVNLGGKIWDGKARDQNGNWLAWSAIKQQKENLNTKQTKSEPKSRPGKVYYPNMAFGTPIKPIQKNYFIYNVKIWSSSKKGNYTASLIIEDGKISSIGQGIRNTKKYIEINGSGLHLTPGIIDEHSHIAARGGINESGQNNSAEVQIGDVINPDDITIYRQLAGGVTTAQILHGSANPIGGQSQIIKLKWGQGAADLKWDTDIKFIKFALGENVKQSNWGSYNSIRFPQTRMGVEQVYIDAFSKAKAYKKGWLNYASATPKEIKNGLTPPRRDLELDALVEILNNQRYITCHSYIQSEITMLMNVADRMGFRVNTFTHALEGYKVADKIKAHGAYASTFADWWAYKYEVKDAIPYNAAILTKQGVITAINSDDDEMGRRLNQEAAKTIKYGGMTETEALKMVTINPAKMLHIDNRVGSIEIGKDADLVLWSEKPLSVYAHPVMVMIEGTIYYSDEKNTEALKKIHEERHRIIQKMWKAKERGDETQEIMNKKRNTYHCDSYEVETNF